ncbi:MAG: preprotein translocase subunit YajC [Pseudomonadota bacterium]
MDFFIADAMAQQGGAQQPSLLESLLPLLILIVLFYFLLIRPQMKRAKEHRKMVSELGKGDEVVTGGGILGRVMEVNDPYLTVELADGVQVKVQKDTITSVLPKGTMKDA